ncbi:MULTISPECIES: hypothetical protein [unclassified Cryobacterium]|uniref:hypothetical protein n=1 Tax=unclassified Cryobacterium TaxID=2649013 RepID=UPI00106B9CC0|nr:MULTISPECIES: hypothetical protein [unclassified Cryobacterium]TFC06517.1 hypothetical protein E3O59_10095 [Cryobacterium sp. MDB2-33-2]TFC12532.1 hypothetical protein E3O51_18325 [Cryobacterium sp. MDB2-10]
MVAYEMNSPDRHERELMAELAGYARELAGTFAVVEESALSGDRLPSISVRPNRLDAVAISIVAEQWLVFAAGTIGGRWELDYNRASDMQLARDLISSAIAGRVTERFGAFRSLVTITLANGSRTTAVGYEGCVTVFLPQPGWQRWGRYRQYAPYR